VTEEDRRVIKFAFSMLKDNAINYQAACFGVAILIYPHCNCDTIQHCRN